MDLWDFVKGLADPVHPRIRRDGQDFAVANPPGPAGSKLRFTTQNLAKDSPNTADVLNARKAGVHEELIWVSPQPGVGEPQRQAPVAAVRVRNTRGRWSGEIRDLTKPDQPIIAEMPEDVDYEALVALADQGQSRPDRAHSYIDKGTGERFSTTEPVDPSKAIPVTQAASPPQGRGLTRRGN